MKKKTLKNHRLQNEITRRRFITGMDLTRRSVLVLSKRFARIRYFVGDNRDLITSFPRP